MAAAEAAAALGRWARDEMELPPLPEPLLRRLCSGPCAPIWEFVTRHVRHSRNVKKIRGNLLWYQHLEGTKEGAGAAAPPGEGLREAVTRLQQELGGLGGALGGAQETALKLEAELEAGLSRRGAGLRRGAELRLLGAAAAREGRRLEAGRDKLRPPAREGLNPELSVAVAAGMEPEVLASVRAVCRLRAAALEELLEPRPPCQAQQLMEVANERWLQAAEALLSRHPPGPVLWALERLALETPPPQATEADPPRDPDLDPNLDSEAPPTVKRVIQECWGAVGGLWGRLPPLAARLPPLGARLAQLRRRLLARLGGDPEIQEAARLALVVAGLGGARGALSRGVQELQGVGGPPPGPPPGELRQRLRQRRLRTLRSRRRLRALAAATGATKARVRLLQARVREAALAGLGPAPLALAEEGQRLQRALGQLGRLGGLGEPPPRPPPDPLVPVCRALGLPLYQDPQGALLGRAASLRQELRGAWPAGRGAWPGGEEAWPEGEGAELPPPGPPAPGGGADAELLLLPRLRAVAAQCRSRIEAWPRLQALVSQWWEQPAQWSLAPPPGSVPFSHWLRRWSRAAQATPLPAGEGEEGRGRALPRP